MAVAYVSVATKNDESFNSSGAAMSGFNLDCTGCDLALVFVGWNTGGSHTVESVTIGGNTMTSLGTASNGGFGDAVQGFRYINPGTGNQSVVVDPSTGSLTRAAVVAAIGLSGVHQTTPASGYVTDDNGGPNTTEADITVSSAADSLVVCGITVEANVTFTCDTGTERADIVRTTNGNIALVVSTEAGAASVTAQHTLSVSQDWSGIGVSIDPAAGASDNLPLLQAIGEA